MKLSPFLMFALVPLALHTPHFGGNARTSATVTRVALDSVQYINADGDTTYIKTDSAAHLVKASPAKVIFLRIGSNAGVRVKRSALAKITASSITNIQIEEGPNLVMQYGDDANPGVLTVTVKEPPAPPASKSKKGGS